MNLKKVSFQFFCFTSFAWIFFLSSASCQTSDTAKVNSKRLTAVLTVEGTLYATSFIGLYSLWYKDYPQTSFHFFNDNSEWMGIDKLGHTTTAYYLGRIGYGAFKWSGLNKKQSIWYGAGIGWLYLTTIEVFDGFSDGWGFSNGDMLANTAGSLLFVTQQLAWDEQRIALKWSFHQTKYAQYRPDLLGKDLIENMLKDYNGQTYWLSGNIHSFLNKSSRFPRWLNIAVGYGAEGMVGANKNPETYNNHTLPHFKRYPKYFLSADIDLTRIQTQSKILKTVFNVLCFIKIPLPTIEYNTVDGFKFHPIYF